MHALLRHDTSQKQYVTVFRQAEPFRDLLCRHPLATLDAVGNEPCLASICFMEVILHVAAQHNHLVGASRCGTFSELEICGSELAPFGTLPVKTVNGRYRANARPMRQTQHHAGAFGMIVNHVRPSFDSL